MAANLTTSLQREIQHRSDSFTYRFIFGDEDSATLKVADLAKEKLFKVKLSLKELGLNQPIEELFTQETIKDRILPLLIEKRILPPQYTPNISQQRPRSEPTFSSPSSSMSAPVSSELQSSPRLNSSEIARLQELAARTQIFIEAAQQLENSGMQQVRQNPEAISRLIESQNEIDRIQGELAVLEQNPLVKQYFRTSRQRLEGLCLATLSIVSGLTGCSRQNRTGRISQLFDLAADVIPVAGTGIKIISGLLKAKNNRDNNQAIDRFAAFFPNLEESLPRIKMISLLLTREQKNDIPNLLPETGLSKTLTQLKDLFIGAELRSPAQRKAIEDFLALMEAIIDGKLTPQMSPEEVVAHILKRPLSQPAISQAPHLVSAPHSSPPVLSQPPQPQPVFPSSPPNAKPATEEDFARYRNEQDQKMNDLQDRLHRTTRDLDQMRKQIGDSSAIDGGGSQLQLKPEMRPPSQQSQQNNEDFQRMLVEMNKRMLFLEISLKKAQEEEDVKQREKPNKKK